MTDYIITNIRLPREDLMAYRQVALSMGKSFSELVREVLAKFVHPAEVTAGKAGKKYPSFWEIEKVAVRGGPKDGSANHDRYIY